MDEKDCKPAKHKNGEVKLRNEENVITKQIESNAFVWQETITVIDLSGRNIKVLDNKVVIPTNLKQLHLSHNELTEVPAAVLNHEKLTLLNLSHNMIQYFNETPKFCHTLEFLDMSYNNLLGLPYWVWVEAPEKLTKLNLGNNENIAKPLNGCFEELLQYSTQVSEVDLKNCRLAKFIGLLATFPKAKSVCLGDDTYGLNGNCILDLPCQGLDKCCDLTRLNVCNTHIYTVSSKIEMFRNLIEVNLAKNNLNGLPNEFCNLENLEICILSCNSILYLPDEMWKLQKLVRLYLDYNELCMLPQNMFSGLSNLKTLDLYMNNLNEVLENTDHLEELDLAQNYFEEPENSTYLLQKEKIRLIHENRYNGRKAVIEKSESDNDYSGKYSEEEDDEELYDIIFNEKKIEDQSPNQNPPSSPEDWDSDEYWIPLQSTIPMANPATSSSWHCFVKQKMKEGNYCPMDAHTVSIAEKVKYERLCNPQVYYESDGQFDDYSSDDT